MIEEILHTNKKQLAILIDPEKVDKNALQALISQSNIPEVGMFLVGGSLLTKSIDDTIIEIKKHTQKPVILFPGNACQVSEKADAILFLSLISGRNPEYLIGNHIISAPVIKRFGLETIPTGYILIDCGTSTSVEYISNTKPIPHKKNDIAVATALAGEMLGLRAIYLEGGSGADTHISQEMIAAVKETISIPLIIGGGIRTSEALQTVLFAGADIVVIGTALEKNPEFLNEFVSVVRGFN